MEEKRHQNLELEKLGYITNDSLFQNMYFYFTNGMTAIFYAKKNKFVDKRKIMEFSFG